MGLKQTLTNVAVDQVREYLHERFERLKELDLDHDGKKDVEQMAEILNSVVEKLKIAVEATDFQLLATGLEQVISGAGMVGKSVDTEKMGATLKELVIGLQHAGKILQLGIAEVKRYDGGLS